MYYYVCVMCKIITIQQYVMLFANFTVCGIVFLYRDIGKTIKEKTQYVIINKIKPKYLFGVQ